VPAAAENSPGDADGMVDDDWRNRGTGKGKCPARLTASRRFFIFVSLFVVLLFVVFIVLSLSCSSSSTSSSSSSASPAAPEAEAGDEGGEIDEGPVIEAEW